MSRGFGEVQRAVLEVFRAKTSGQPLDSIDVTTRVHGEHATRSQYSATRRALSSLEKKGLLIRVGRRGFWGGRSHYVMAPRHYAQENWLIKLQSGVAPNSF